MRSSSPEPYKEVVSVIEQAFRLRRLDAMPRAVTQLREWRHTIRVLDKRREGVEAMAVKTACDAIQNMIDTNVGKYIPKDGDGPTPEQARYPVSRDSIKSLEDADRITPEQARAARDVQRIVEIITTGSKPKCQTYQRGAVGYRPMGFMTAETAYRWSQVYVPWMKALKLRKDKRAHRLAVKVIIDGLSLDAARRQLRMSYEKAHEFLVDALDMYIKFKSEREEGNSPATIRRGADVHPSAC